MSPLPLVVVVRRPVNWLFTTLLAIALPGCLSAEAPSAVVDQQESAARLDADLERLLALVQNRLDLMHNVARWKWDHGQEIADPVREAALLNRTEQLAHELGLDAGLAGRFMSAQMDAGKLVQRADFGRWETQPPSPDDPFPDLQTELRPRIDEINREMLKILARLALRLNDEYVQQRLAQFASETESDAGFDTTVITAAVEPLRKSDNLQ